MPHYIGSFKHIVIQRFSAHVFSFYCVFEKGRVKECLNCPYYLISSKFCNKLNTQSSRCTKCTRRLDIRYIHVMNKLKELIPNIKMKCCICQSEVS